MSNKLKLTGVASYMSVLLANVHILKGDVILVNDDLAGKIAGLNRPSDNDGITIFFFTEAKPSEAVTYDFTGPAVPAQKAPAEVAPVAAPAPQLEDSGDGVLSDSGADFTMESEPEPEPEEEVSVEEAPAPVAPPAAEPVAEAVARPVQRKRATK